VVNQLGWQDRPTPPPSACPLMLPIPQRRRHRLTGFGTLAWLCSLHRWQHPIPHSMPILSSCAELRSCPRMGIETVRIGQQSIRHQQSWRGAANRHRDHLMSGLLVHLANTHAAKVIKLSKHVAQGWRSWLWFPTLPRVPLRRHLIDPHHGSLMPSKRPRAPNRLVSCLPTLAPGTALCW